MIKIINKSWSMFIAISMILAMLLMGCGDDADEGEELNADISGAPLLPPDESMAVDLSAFGTGELPIP